MNTYKVTYEQVQLRSIFVEAETEEEAKRLVEDEEADFFGDSFESTLNAPVVSSVFLA
jgi:hypothetical protein